MASRSTARRVNQRSGLQYRVNGTEAYAPERVVPSGRGTNAYRARNLQERAVPVGRKGTARSAKAVSAVERNRSKALGVNRAYVVFLALVSIATVFMCVHYLQLKSTITAQMEANDRLESKLVALRSENDALLENVNNTLDWERIKDVAINELGMNYATEEQIVWYNAEESSYIRQYAEVPLN